jgi:hypothetical protein
MFLFYLYTLKNNAVMYASFVQFQRNENIVSYISNYFGYRKSPVVKDYRSVDATK